LILNLLAHETKFCLIGFTYLT